MKHSSIPSAQILVQTCKALEISRVVISPGSRNAPLIIGFTQDPYFSCYSIVDERSAGFFALGMARETGSPVLLICTSGTALLNYYPAMAEASYSEIPLIVVSADRPSYKVDIGDGQTIRQKGIYSLHCDVNEELEQDLAHGAAEFHKCQGIPMPSLEVLEELQAEINQRNEKCTLDALQFGKQNRAPVHINIPFEEPLYDKVESLSFTPQINSSNLPTEEDPINLETFLSNWEEADRKMILIGQANESLLTSDICGQLALDPSVLVFTETTSNTHHPSFFPSIDSIIAPLEKLADKEEYFSALQPDI
ncbi:MAG: 2-succinyl-5-enolpyruvyl-6-hydroxy-3-cyclohexene-1-carboxylate synthase, partial [Eudoraea sp.]|nr:2-succinyl-5-enolpyruvyl-6-hydroxy-3-cyclohexene-1-carboxylate synthase [Eudoraea sp.]